jgi:hypothetical protein
MDSLGRWSVTKFMASSESMKDFFKSDIERA